MKITVKNVLFWAKKNFFGFNNPFETIKDFNWAKKANNGKTYFSRLKKIIQKGWFW
jgi:hypothetical protein|tara:strand:+ start:67 stop:234 length:168 start_codon:yes stop_codon:yes gene_type:complete